MSFRRVLSWVAFIIVYWTVFAILSLLIAFLIDVPIIGHILKLMAYKGDINIFYTVMPTSIGIISGMYCSELVCRSRNGARYEAYGVFMIAMEVVGLANFLFTMYMHSKSPDIEIANFDVFGCIVQIGIAMFLFHAAKEMRKENYGEEENRI